MALSVTPEELTQYAERFSSPESPSLKALNERTYSEVHAPQMLSGHLQGLFLEFVSRMIQPFRILEIGTYTGYSAICLAKGLKPGGFLDTIDVDALLNDLRQEYWQQEGLDTQIRQHIGKAMEVIPQLEGDFDLVFIDADKRNYGGYFDLVIDRMPSGAWLLADNVLFHGEVVLDEAERSKAANHIHRFNLKMEQEKRVERVILPFRDGLMLMRKK